MNPHPNLIATNIPARLVLDLCRCKVNTFLIAELPETLWMRVHVDFLWSHDSTNMYQPCTVCSTTRTLCVSFEAKGPRQIRIERTPCSDFNPLSVKPHSQHPSTPTLLKPDLIAAPRAGTAHGARASSQNGFQELIRQTFHGSGVFACLPTLTIITVPSVFMTMPNERTQDEDEDDHKDVSEATAATTMMVTGGSDRDRSTPGRPVSPVVRSVRSLRR